MLAAIEASTGAAKDTRGTQEMTIVIIITNAINLLINLDFFI
jgi:hypothetical protein